MTRDEANRAFDYFSNRGDASVFIQGAYLPKHVPEQWTVTIRPDEQECDLKALIDRADEGGFKLVLRMLSQGSFEVLTEEEQHRRKLGVG